MNPIRLLFPRLLRALRRASDRRHLMELDARMLRDIGLTQEDVLRDVPFAAAREAAWVVRPAPTPAGRSMKQREGRA